MNENRLSRFASKAIFLQKLTSESLTKRQLFKIAQEAALTYHQISNQLTKNPPKDRETLAKLGKIFSSIENNAISKFHKISTVPKNAVF